MNKLLYIDLFKADVPKPPPPAGKGATAPAANVGVTPPKLPGTSIKYDYVPTKPEGSSRPWEASGSGFKAPEASRGMDSGLASGDAASKPKAPGGDEQKKIKTPEGLSSKQSILSSNSDDFKDHTVADHYKIMGAVGHDDKLVGMHKDHIQEKVKGFSPEDHAKLAVELKAEHEKNPNEAMSMAADFHGEEGERGPKGPGDKTSVSSDSKKMKRDAAAAKTKADASDKKAADKEAKDAQKLKDKQAKAEKKHSDREAKDEKKAKKREAKQKKAVQGAGQKAKKKTDDAKAKADKKVKDRDRKVEEKEIKDETKAAEQAAKDKEKEDSPELQRAKAADHNARAQKLHDNLSSHLDSGELDTETYGRLSQTRDAAHTHTSVDKVTPKHAKELKEAEKLAGDHGSGSADEHAEAAEKNKPDPAVEEAKAATHKEAVQDMKDNLDAHLADENTSELKKDKLQKIRDILDSHGDGPPTPEQQQQLKELQKLAGAHGKGPPKEAKTPKEGGGKKGSSSDGFSGSSAQAMGHRLGAASASEDNAGDIGAAGIDYAAEGAVAAGHHLLSSKDKEEEVTPDKPSPDKPKEEEKAKDDKPQDTKLRTEKSVRLYLSGEK